MKLQGLYVITDPELTKSEDLINKVAEAIAGGARLVQYRNKTADTKKKLWEAQDLVSLCRGLNVPLIINDDIKLATKVGAAGVHLGQSDQSIKKARDILGRQAIIGISCHSSLTLAKEAEDQGADYVAFGRFFTSKTKPDAPEVEVETLALAKQKLRIPIAAIGGITQDNCQELIKTGADMLAVVNGVFGQESPGNSAKLITNQIDLFQE